MSGLYPRHPSDRLRRRFEPAVDLSFHVRVDELARTTMDAPNPDTHVTDEDDSRALAGFSLIVEPHREVLWIKLAGELDIVSASVLGERVRELRAAGFDQLIIDLRDLLFVDVVGVRQLLSLARDAQEVGWKLWLIDGKDQVHRLFVLTDMLQQLPFESPVSALTDCHLGTRERAAVRES
jgi:anti-anti-sigma factor